MTPEAFLGWWGTGASMAAFLLQSLGPSLQLDVVWLIPYLFFLTPMGSHQNVLGLLNISLRKEYDTFSEE